MVYLTGDTHRDFDRFYRFCEMMDTKKNDIMIILGDAGINYFLDDRDDDFKAEISNFPLTFFCIHGNHEERPYLCKGYEEIYWGGATAYMDKRFPNQIFAKDGEIYTINGKETLVIGGAYSVDKPWRIATGNKWFKSEQPDSEIKKRVEKNLNLTGWKVDTVLTHAAPVCYEPVHMFIKGLDQSKVDKTTENWLQTIADRLEFKRWFFGHYHGEWQTGKFRMLYYDIIKF